MDKEVFFSNEHATLWFYPKEKIVHNQFHKYVGGEGFRKVLRNGTEFFVKNNCEKWLSDDTNLSVVNQEDADWATNEWYSQIKNAGWKYWAMVKPKNIIGKMSLKRHVNNVRDEEITMKVFEKEEDALNWLKNV